MRKPPGVPRNTCDGRGEALSVTIRLKMLSLGIANSVAWRHTAVGSGDRLHGMARTLKESRCRIQKHDKRKSMLRAGMCIFVSGIRDAGTAILIDFGLKSAIE